MIPQRTRFSDFQADRQGAFLVREITFSTATFEALLSTLLLVFHHFPRLWAQSLCHGSAQGISNSDFLITPRTFPWHRSSVSSGFWLKTAVGLVLGLLEA